ncbi:transposase [Kitasatospora sp. NPDC051914]|uniref:transposase n=1 Tax=Kitasatospora sp. NPDC051914 TaxID=3154945 RepID=UPI00343B820C
MPDRDANSVAAWLREYAGVEIVCRDRAQVFADGPRAGAPNAQHCADKWHVWHNLAEAVERLVSRHRTLLRDLLESGPEPEPPSRRLRLSRPWPMRRCPSRTRRGSSSIGSATPVPRSGPRSSRA